MADKEEYEELYLRAANVTVQCGDLLRLNRQLYTTCQELIKYINKLKNSKRGQ